jgi:hypothetical protein
MPSGVTEASRQLRRRSSPNGGRLVVAVQLQSCIAKEFAYGIVTLLRNLLLQRFHSGVSLLEALSESSDSNVDRTLSMTRHDALESRDLARLEP